MPSTIDRYIFREIIAPFLLGMAAFTGALLMGRFLQIAELVVSKGVPFTEISLMIACLFPTFSLVTIPMSLLLAILLAFGRLSSDSEVIAMKASGMGLWRLMLPVFAFAAMATVATQALAIYAVPLGNRTFKEMLVNAVENSADIEIRERVFLDTIPGMVIYVDSYDRPSRTIKGIMIQDNRKPENPLTIFARSGVIVFDRGLKQVNLTLLSGSIHNIHEESYRLVNFNEYDLKIKIEKSIRTASKSEVDMTLPELSSGMTDSKIKPQMRKTLELEYHRRFATPFACLVFAFSAVPLGIQNRRSGKGGGFAISIGLLIIYYVTLTAFKTAGEKNLIHAALAMWAPNILFMILGVWLSIRGAAEKTVLGPFAPSAVAGMVKRYTGGWRKSK